MTDLATGTEEGRAPALVRDLHQRLRTGGHEIPVRLWDGETLGPSDADYRLVLRHPWSLREMLLPHPSDLAVGEAYLDDMVDVDGSMTAALRDLGALDRQERSLVERLGLARTLLALPAPPRRARPGRGPRSRGRAHSRRRDAEAVRHHYDVGNDLYRLFLDERMVYSCAVFDEQDRAADLVDRDALARAQRRKMELVCRKLDLRPGDELLDVGCGWGALILHAATHHDVRATGVTLSTEQAGLAHERIARAGLGDRVRVEVADYRELSGAYDAVASVGMVEHVGSDQLESYAAHLRDLLRPGGRLLNHGITTGRRQVVRDFSRQRDTFVGRYVFPDGALVPASTTIRAIERSGLELWDVQQLRPHYAMTLERWVANLEHEAAAAREAVGQRTYRIWRAYMAGSVVGFECGDLGVVQVLAVRPPVGVPLGRAWMEPDT